ncbi:flagellar hook-associated protein 1 FlgK [Lebetimonas natsushimae]|uniref:Flagellar hook-associated protein 1 n=1 Tax=Lebetimonas natsushimae TaxID=1936991 RepID=A0A292YF42_9BACT|nr:flagellar hook-associated protein FlgK [Lebetimonas natsushimae]GAX87664.1 flagellar hook-associated protein 1 FlgK [Lebetimonas natsushimae]
MGISSAFNIAQTGLNVHQKAIDVTSNNIANASNKSYTRQRAQISALGSVSTTPGDIGLGVKIQSIVRIKDIFLFNRYTDASSNLQNLSTQEQYLQEISTYFPDTTDNGIYKNLKDFFDAWQNLASNPNDSSVKVDLASKTKILVDSIKEVRNSVTDIQKSINDEIKTKADEINNIIKKIADLNKSITAHEANNINHANDLRDERDKLEKRLKELINVKIYKNGLKSFKSGGSSNIDYEKSYSISLGGYSLLDNSNYYPIKLTDNQGNIDINIQKEDHTLVNVTKDIKGGEIGGLLSIRGKEINKNGEPIDGIIGEILNKLDTFASSLIKNVNSLYSQAAQPQVSTDQINVPITISPDLADKPLSMLNNILTHPVRNGNIILNIYDEKGNFVKNITVSVDKNNSINDVIKNINNKIYNNNNNADYGAELVNGQLKFVKGSYDSNGNFTASVSNEESSKILVKDDGATLFSSLNEIEYMPLKKINEKLPLSIENGSFNLVIYNEKGEIIANRKIIVNMNSNDPKFSTIEGIISQINTPNIDDNKDNNQNNDVDDYYNATYLNGKFVLSKKTDENTYVGIDNDSAKFGGTVGFNKFFEGNSAKNIDIKQELYETPSKIQANKTPSSGDNKIANSILQLQFEKINFYENKSTTNETIFEYYRNITGKLANNTQNITSKKEVAETLFTNISNQYYSVSGVNIDEELINLEKFQRGYQANAKVITTINQMLDALFNIT